MSGKLVETEKERLLADLIDEWHTGGSSCQLHEFLGVTMEQYSAWVEDKLTADELYDKRVPTCTP